MHRFVLLLAITVLSSPQLAASSYYHDPSPLAAQNLDTAAAQAAWKEFQSLNKATPVRLPDRPVGRFANGNQELLLAPDGRAAMRYLGSEGAPDSAWLGVQVADNGWIELELHRPAIDPDRFEPWWADVRDERVAHEAEMAAWRAEFEPRLRRLLKALELGTAEALTKLAEEDPDNFPAEFIDHLARMDSESRQSMIDGYTAQLDSSNAGMDAEEGSHGVDESAPREGLSLRLLAIPHADGWLLVDDGDVKSMTDAWNAYGRLSFAPDFWNDTPDAEEKIEGSWRFISLKQPLPPGLPRAISALLLDVPRTVSVLEWLDDPAEPAWKAHEATLRFHVDFGAAFGARAGMSLHGIAPDERWSATLESVDEHSGTASLRLKRFSPWDTVELPTRGLRFSTRSPHATSENCGFDFSAAVKARITEVLDAEAIEWDPDGFGFVRLRIDQGRAQGLIVGDELSAEDYSLGPGEGRVQSVDSQQAVVLWRMQRFHASMSVEPPPVGKSLVTPAWRRASYDTFGSPNADDTKSAVESMQDASELH